MRRLMALAATLATATSTRALIIDFVEVDNVVSGVDALYPGFNDAGWRTYDLVVTVTPYAGDWTGASVYARVDGLFFQHGVGGDVESTLDLLTDHPALEFDTFFADPPALFDAEQPMFAVGPDWTDSSVEATWFDREIDDGGPYTLARFTFTGDIWLRGDMSYLFGDGLYGYDFTTFPTPGSGAVLLLGCLALGRRRVRAARGRSTLGVGTGFLDAAVWASLGRGRIA